MTIEEQQLSEMLHRLTPEPPRSVTVEDVAIHLANQAGPRRSDNAPRTDRAFGDGHTAVLHIGRRGRTRFAPALAAASVIIVVGASAGIAVALTSSHHDAKAPASGASTVGTTPATTAPSADTTPPGSGRTYPPVQPVPIAGSLWHAELIVQQSLDPGTLVGGGNSLYALSDGELIRVDLSKRQIVEQASVPGTGAGRPVVDGNEVWVASASGSGMTLSGFDASTLNPAGTVAVPGGGLSQPEGALAVGSGGDLYVAAGSNVAVVDPGSRSVIRHINVSDGEADSVAITPDGGTLYAGVEGGGTFRLEAFNAATGASLGGSAMSPSSSGGYLVATDGGVWGTTGALMTQRVWFAPGGNLAKMRSVTGGVDGGLDSAPTYVNGAIWVGGIQSLECLDPASGKLRAGSQIPGDSGVPEHFGSVAFAGGHAYTAFQDQHAQQVGIAAVTPPAACGAGGTTGS